jgi:hydroxymethylbilane synthase
VSAERAFLARMEGGCQIPIGTHARLERQEGGPPRLVLQALVGSLDGTTVIRGTRSGPPEEAETIGGDLAGDLLDRGAGALLRSIREAAEPAGDESAR